MQAELINPFLTVTKNVLETMAQVSIKAAKPQRKEGTSTYGEVTGLIGMTSESLSGCMILSFSEKCILTIVSNMLMEPLKEKVDNDVVDAVGEITNMICGGVKAELAKNNQTFDLATPTMVVGRGVDISCYSKDPTIVIPFETENGNFVIEANFTSK